MIKQQPGFELTLDANQVHRVIGDSRLTQVCENVLSIMMPAQRLADFRPGRSFIPKDHDTGAATVEEVSGCTAARLDEACLIAHRNDVDREFDARSLTQQCANSTTEYVFQPTRAAFNDDADPQCSRPGHQTRLAKRPMV